LNHCINDIHSHATFLFIVSFFGRVFRIATFGESHGPAIGVVIDGVPPGVPLTEDDIAAELRRRMFCHIPVLNPRCEPEEFQILSGIKNGKTIGTPIAIVIWNQKQISSYYEELWMKPRPGHADLTYYLRYGENHDHRGGGRASGRETVARVAAGAVAKKVLKHFLGIEISGHIIELGGISINRNDYTFEDIKQSWNKPLPVVDDDALNKMINAIKQAAADGDSIGGAVEVYAINVPPALGEPVFDKLKADLAKAAMSLGTAVAFEIGRGLELARMRGSEANDPIILREGRPSLERNYVGGILGGLSTGDPIYFRTYFKPTPSIRKPQRTVDLSRGVETEIVFRGRYDVTTVPKALVALEAMTAIVLLDHAMLLGLIPRRVNNVKE